MNKRACYKRMKRLQEIRYLYRHKADKLTIGKHTKRIWDLIDYHLDPLIRRYEKEILR